MLSKTEEYAATNPVSASQQAMLIDLHQGKPIKRNAAVRKGLEDRGFITVTNREAWEMELTDAGRAAIGVKKAAPATPINRDYSQFSDRGGLFPFPAPTPTLSPVRAVATIPAVPTSTVKVDASLYLFFEDIGMCSDRNRQYRKVRMNILHRAENERIGQFLSTDLHLSQVDMLIAKLTELRNQMLPGGEPASAAPSSDAKSEEAA